MPPKFCQDKDGDIPPCSVMWDFSAVERWEQIKQARCEFKERKAPCSCCYFEGKIPSDHKCFIPVRYSFWKKAALRIRNKLRAFRA